MKRICIYGKGGIGKSTVVANTAAALARRGQRVMVVGCDPKADTTRVLTPRRMDTVLEVFTRTAGVGMRLEDVAQTGAFGVLCLESGGPQAGEGCAGRGIATALSVIKELEIVERFAPDYLLYDVLGDVVCGGFSTPLRARVAEAAYIVTTSDYMALYAANNICRCIEKYAGRGGCRLGGLIFNERSVASDRPLVEAFAQQLGTQVIGHLPMDPAISRAELERQCVVACAPSSPAARAFEGLAEALARPTALSVPRPLDADALEQLGGRIARQVSL